MTTNISESRSPSPSAPISPPSVGECPPRRRRLLALGAAVGVLPYLTLKVIWVAGGTIGVTAPDSPMSGAVMTGMNAFTALLDLCVILLACALTFSWGRRLPALAVLLPAWIGTGLLAPIALVNLPAVIIGGMSVGDGSMSPWIGPVVYGGFAWQAACLLTAFVLYARDRWPAHGPTAVPVPVRSLAFALAGGGAAFAAFDAVLGLTAGIGVGSWPAIYSASFDGLLALVGAVGVLALVRGTTRWLAAVVAAWVGSGVTFAWGLWGAALTLGETPLAATGSPAAGLAALSGVIAGFALAIAGLLALSGDNADVRA